MAKFEVTTSNGFTLLLTVTETATSVDKNTSTLSYSLVLKNGAYNFSNYAIGYSVSLNGKIVASQEKSSAEKSAMMSDNMTLPLCSGDGVSVTHKDDGSKSIAVAFSINMTKASYTPGSMSGSGTMKLTTIARASEPTLSRTTFNIGDGIRIYTNRKSTSFTHKVQIVVGDTTYDLATGVKDSILWDTDASDILYKNCKSSQSVSGTVKVTTYNESSVIGSAKTVKFTAKVDESSNKPTVTMTLEKETDPESWVTTEYIQNRSKVKGTFSGTAKNSASISSYILTVNDKSVSGESPLTSEILTKSGEITVKGQSKDTREFYSEEVTDTITVIPYDKPIITNHPLYGDIVCSRCDEEGNLSPSGEHLKVRFAVKCYCLADGENTASLFVQYIRTDYDSGEISLDNCAEVSGGGAESGYIKTYLIDTKVDGVVLSKDKTYIVTIGCRDRFGADDTEDYPIPTESVCLHLGVYGDRAAFGTYADIAKALIIAKDWDFYLKGNRLSDFVTEQGTKENDYGTWYYRKWNSGIVECMCNIITNDIIDMELVGNVYRSPSSFEIRFPFTFQTFYDLQATGRTEDGGSVWLAQVTNYYSDKITYWVYAATSGTRTGMNVRVHVVGKLKEE